MARKKTADRTRRPRLPRERKPREEVPASTEARWDQYDYKWLAEISNKKNALKILGNDPARPYWVSLLWTSGCEPVSGYLPCTYFRTKTRAYHGFLFAQHRDAFYETHRGIARKEFIWDVREARLSK